MKRLLAILTSVAVASMFGPLDLAMTMPASVLKHSSCSRTPVKASG